MNELNILKKIDNFFKVLTRSFEAIAEKANEIIKLAKEQKIEVDNAGNLLKNFEKIFEIISHGLEVMTEKANEIIGMIIEQKKEKTEEKLLIDAIPGIQEERTKIEEEPLSAIANEPAAVKETAPKPRKYPAISKTDTVLEIINNSADALSLAALEEKTGFGHKSILDVVHKLKKQGKIKSVYRGVYSKIDGK